MSLPIFGFDGKIPELGTGVKPIYSEDGVEYDPLDVPEQFAGPGRAHLLTRQVVQDCCCVPPPNVPVRPFAHWVWDCAKTEWVLHPAQNVGFYNYNISDLTNDQNQMAWSVNRGNPFAYYGHKGYSYWPEPIGMLGGSVTTIKPRSELKLFHATVDDTSPDGYSWEAWEAYLADDDAEWLDRDLWWCGWSAEPKGTLAFSAQDTYKLFSGYNHYSNMVLKTWPSPPTPNEFSADIIYEGDWLDADKDFYFIYARNAIPGQEIPHCRYLKSSGSNIHAVTVGDIITAENGGNPILTSADLPAPPPPPPAEWTDFFCTPCDTDPEAPDAPTREPDPIPDPEDEDPVCQEYWKYEWDCDEGEWVEVLALAVRRGVIAGTVIRRGLEKHIWGVVVDCEGSVGEGPGGGNPPPEGDIQKLCPAPDECPCTEADPAEWPCGGLFEVYTINSWQYEPQAFGIWAAGQRIYRLKSPWVVLDRPGDRCGYSGDGAPPIEFSSNFGASWADVTDVFLSTGLSTKGWRLTGQVGSPPFFVYVHKTTGQTPVGSYTENVEQSNQEPTSAKAWGTVS